MSLFGEFMPPLAVWRTMNLTTFRFPPPIVTNYKFDRSKQCISTMMVEIDFLQKKSVDSNPYDSDNIAREFIQHFNNQAFSVGQQVL